MKYDSLFDVVGHVMVGPSSSHTAGACQISYIAQLLLGSQPKKCTIYLHGSFAETFKGHGTDRAIVAGLLGLKPDDERLRNSFEIAKERGLNYSFEKIDLGADYHPNSVLLKLENEEEKLEIIGSSIGGGNIIIKEINGLEAGFNGDVPTLITMHRDTPGMISKITKKISDYNLNIGSMKVSKNPRKKIAISWIELNDSIPQELGEAIEGIKGMLKVRVLNV
ncbi:MAG: L-serine ammonia-lyase, iron-sulfur-dependent subunit beta [Candidatus Heimdallarchaeaceae archaeon]